LNNPYIPHVKNNNLSFLKEFRTSLQETLITRTT